VGMLLIVHVQAVPPVTAGETPVSAPGGGRGRLIGPPSLE
jgi:hypothetical protein